MFASTYRHVHLARSLVLDRIAVEGPSAMGTVDLRTARSVWSAPGLPALSERLCAIINAGKPGALYTFRTIAARISLIVVVVFCVWIGAAQAAETLAEHVLIIGCDGFGSIGITPTNTPILHKLMRQGAYTLHARGVMPTSSSPNWASMIMGAGPEQHGVTSNDWETNKFEIAPVTVGSGGMFPTIFGLLREQRPKAWIACVHDLDGFGRLLEPRAPDLIENVKGSPATARRAAEVIRQHKPTFLFIHFDDVDHAGHEFGWLSPEFFQAVSKMDDLIGSLLDALTEAGIREQTVVIMSADHGGKDKTHGGPTMEELEIPFIIAGPGIKAGHELKSPVNTYDTAATVALLFGLAPPEAWIGKPIREALN